MEGRRNVINSEVSIEYRVDEEGNPLKPSLELTVETIWSLLMQCATDEKAAARYLSLFSGQGMDGPPQDCQCWDFT